MAGLDEAIATIAKVVFDTLHVSYLSTKCLLFDAFICMVVLTDIAQSEMNTANTIPPLKAPKMRP